MMMVDSSGARLATDSVGERHVHSLWEGGSTGRRL